jgi:O-antigen/teichoic acid export membrane protein
MTDLDARAGPPADRRHRRLGRVFAVARTSAGRLSWGLADQAVSSLTNFAVGAYVARSLGPAGFGVFTLAWVTFGVLLNISRGLTTDPLVVRFSGVSPGTWRAAVARSSGMALLVGVATGAMSVFAGAVVGGEIGATFVALGLVLPALLLQDSWRFAFFAAAQGRRAFINDLVWAATLAPAMLLAAQRGTVFSFVLAWGLSGAFAAVVGIVQARIFPRLIGIHRWFREHRDLGVRYLVENVSNSGSGMLRMYGLGAIAGLADVGAVRGALLLLGPFYAVLMGLALVAVAEASRLLRRSHRRTQQFCLLLGGGQAAGALVWGTALLLLPDVVGQYVLGEVWEPAAALIVPTTLSVAALSVGAGAFAGLRALGAARRSMRAQLLTSAAFLTGGLVGASMAGAQGSAWGVALANLLGAAVAWQQFRVALSDVADPTVADITPTPPHADQPENDNDNDVRT